jgi:hypothetical protein
MLKFVVGERRLMLKFVAKERPFISTLPVEEAANLCPRKDPRWKSGPLGPRKDQKQIPSSLPQASAQGVLTECWLLMAERSPESKSGQFMSA